MFLQHSSTVMQELSEEVFSKVERLFLLGLRAADPVRRARFFSLYHKHIAAGLFERLQFIICVQVGYKYCLYSATHQSV
jgi:transformation/transcription domain-associated protein